MQSYRQRARMPPSRIPEAQVQAILAQLREGGVYPDAPGVASASTPATRPRHTAGMVAAVVASALMLGLALSPLSDLVWNRSAAPDRPPAVPLAPPPAVASIEPAVSAPLAAPKVPVARAASAPPARSRSRCLAGGPCGRADVAAAERRLRAAYASAQKAGVARASLASVKRRWDAQRRRYGDSPRTSIRTLRSLAADLNRKSAAARAEHR